MAYKWHATAHPGIRYREHPTRLWNKNPDRYFALRYYRNGRRIEEGLGWQSQGWTIKKCADLRAELEKSNRIGEGPSTLAAKRQDLRRQATLDAAGKENSYRSLVERHYLPWANREKKSAWLDTIRFTNHLFPEFGDLPLSAITPQSVLAYRDRLLETLSRSTVVQILALLRKSINLFAQYGLYNQRNPVSDVKMPRLDNARERFLSREEYNRLVEATASMEDQDLHDAIILAVHTGMRLGEISRLVVQDVDLTHGFLTVREDDGKPGGKIPLNKTVLAMLRERLSGRAGLVFTATDKRGKALSKKFTRLAYRLGLNDGTEDRQHVLTFHSLRHTFASWLAMADVDLYRIQKLMRHKTFAMTQRYAHLRPSWLRDDVEILCAAPSHPDQTAQ